MKPIKPTPRDYTRSERVKARTIARHMARDAKQKGA